MRVVEENYDVCVVGAGHAGCEAALACARLGLETIMFTVSVDSIAMMPCNPNIGGSSKGHLVREIDALGGEMGKNIDKTFIQSKMLNKSKGPAVHSHVFHLVGHSKGGIFFLTQTHEAEQLQGTDPTVQLVEDKVGGSGDILHIVVDTGDDGDTQDQLPVFFRQSCKVCSCRERKAGSSPGRDQGN